MNFQAMQKYFEQVFLAERKIPTSVTIAEADYNSFCESMHLKGSLIISSGRITHILCWISMEQIPFACNADWPSGQVSYTWKQAEPPPETFGEWFQKGSSSDTPRTFPYPFD